jgi:AmmeMemoRadiSam system protein A
MAPSPWADSRLQDAEAALLLDLADDAIVEGLRHRPAAVPDAADLPPALQEKRGVFVTLLVDGALNGCIGSIDGDEPLGQAVPRLARSAAFADWRLPSLRTSDYPSLTIEVSLLSPLEPVPAASRRQLLDQLRPGVDGLLLEAGPRRGVFLPVVWEKVPDPDDFLDHLLNKAGIRPRTWPAEMAAWRFTVEKLTRRAGDDHAPVDRGRTSSATAG